MPAKHEKLLESMRRTKAGWRASGLRKVYVGFGFEEINTGGDTKYRHPEHKFLIAYVSRASGELSKAYAEEAVKLIDRLKQLNADADNEESEGEGKS